MADLKKIRYFQYKFEAYKNNKKKLAFYEDGLLIPLIPYSDPPRYGLTWGEPKEVNEEILNKYWKEISRSDFFFKEIDHIPVV